MALFIIAGYWLDEKFDTGPWLLLTGIFLGIVSSVWTVAKLVIELDMAEKKKKESRERTDKTAAD
jgi:F0F1-type ATP synthase assembly protein I